MTTVLKSEKDHFRTFLRGVLNDPTLSCQITYISGSDEVTVKATLEEAKIPAIYGSKKDSEKEEHWTGNAPDLSFYCPTKTRWLTVMWENVVSVTTAEV